MFLNSFVYVVPCPSVCPLSSANPRGLGVPSYDGRKFQEPCVPLARALSSHTVKTIAFSYISSSTTHTGIASRWRSFSSYAESVVFTTTTSSGRPRQFQQSRHLQTSLECNQQSYITYNYYIT